MKDIVVEIDPLTQCQLRCPTCPQGRGEMANHNAPIKPDALRYWLRLIANQRNIKTISLYWCGEPFLHPKLPELVRICNSYCEDVLVITNGNTGLDALPEYARCEPHTTSVSVSGWSQEVYERHHVGGSVAKARNFILRAHALGMKSIQLNCHLYPDSLPEIPLWKRFAKSLGYPLITRFPQYLFLSDYQRDRGFDDYWVTVREILSFAPRHRECQTMDRFVCLSPQGDFYHCQQADDLRLPRLGHVENTSIDEHIALRRASATCRRCVANGWSYMANGHQVLPDWLQIWRACRWNLPLYFQLPLRKLAYQYLAGYRNPARVFWSAVNDAAEAERTKM